MRHHRTLPVLLSVILYMLWGCASTGQVSGGMAQEGAAPVGMVESVLVYDEYVLITLDREGPVGHTIYRPSGPYNVVVEIPGFWVPNELLGQVGGIGPGSMFADIRVANVETGEPFVRFDILLKEPLMLGAETEGRILTLSEVAEPVPGPVPAESTAVMVDALRQTQAAPAEEPAKAEAAPAEEPTAEPVPEPVKTVPIMEYSAMMSRPATKITSVKYTSEGTTLYFVISGDGQLKPDIFTWKNRIVIDVPGVKMEAKLPREVIYPVEAQRAGAYADKVRIVLETGGAPRFDVATTGSEIRIALPGAALDARKPGPRPTASVTVKDSPAVESPKSEPVATDLAGDRRQAPGPDERVIEEAMRPNPRPAPADGVGARDDGDIFDEQPICDKNVSLDFQQADVVPIFRFIGEICNFNVVIHPDVSGSVDIKLLDVPAGLALDIILEMTSLGMSYKPQGRILTIASTEIFTQQRELEARRQQAEEKVESLIDYELKLKYISSADFLNIVQKQKANSARGTWYVDEVTNTVYIKDTKSSVQEMKRLAEKFDDTKHGTMQYGPQPQIMIEAKMVQVSRDYSRSLGISWGVEATDENFSFIDDDSSMLVGWDTGSVGAGFFNLGYAETLQVQMSLQALESVGQTKSLANPRVITLDKQSASITQGTQIPYSTIEDGTAKTQFQSAALNLSVTPTIKPDGYIELKVTASNDQPTAVGSEIGINTQNVNTQARVKNGGTLVLGGIYTNTESTTETRIPVLGKIPVLGSFFKKENETSSPKELLIFITPTVVEK